MITVILYLAIGLWYVFAFREERYVKAISDILDAYGLCDEGIRKIFTRITLMLIIDAILWPILIVARCLDIINDKIHH